MTTVSFARLEAAAGKSSVFEHDAHAARPVAQMHAHGDAQLRIVARLQVAEVAEVEAQPDPIVQKAHRAAADVAVRDVWLA